MERGQKTFETPKPRIVVYSEVGNDPTEVDSENVKTYLDLFGGPKIMVHEGPGVDKSYSFIDGKWMRDPD